MKPTKDSKGSNIIVLENETTLDLPPDRVLEGAHGKLESVIVIGWDKDGEEYFASSVSDGGAILWLVERFKKMLLDD